VVILGDNIFQDPIEPAIARMKAWEGGDDPPQGGDDPERFGVARLEGSASWRSSRSRSGPRAPRRHGLLRLRRAGLRYHQTLAPSRPGELEITDVNNRYLEWNELGYHLLDGWWTDAGTVPSLYRATQLVATDRDNPVLCHERRGDASAAAD
jgi:glucose-1-phosphate thymidylyltransferase